jgi:hypothetical protein
MAAGIDRTRSEITDSLRMIRKGLKRERRSRRAVISKAAMDVNQAMQAKSKEVARKREAFGEALLLDDESPYYRFVSAMFKVLSGRDNRPIAWIDSNFHEHSGECNEVGVRMDTETRELTFALAAVQEKWLLLKQYFDVSTLVDSYNMCYSLEDEELSTEEKKWHRLGGDFFLCEDHMAKNIFHRLFHPVGDTQIASETANGQFVVHPRHAARATMTYHFIVATLKPNVATPVDFKQE